MTSLANQQTIARSVAVHGFGYWGGQDVRLEFLPARADAGITFVRTDLRPHVAIPARTEYRVEAARRTVLAVDGNRVEMVEHVLSALAGLGVDNCEIHVDAAEMPGCDGSAQPFVEALDRAGVVRLDAPRRVLRVTEPIRIGDEDTWIEAMPTESGGLSIEVYLDYPHSAAIGQQTLSLRLDRDTYRRELAPCRTFILQSEAQALLSMGLGQRVTAHDLLIFDDEGPLENQLLFPDECVRHKALDLIGDLAITGCDVHAHVVAHKSGHQLNGELATAFVARSKLSPPRRISA